MDVLADVAVAEADQEALWDPITEAQMATLLRAGGPQRAVIRSYVDEFGVFKIERKVVE